MNSSALPTVRVIAPRRGRAGPDWGELWRYRELLYFLIWRDIKVRYRQTALGAAWAILQPFTTMVVFSVFFGRLAGLDQRTGDTPYSIYVYAGLLPWTFFSNAITSSSISLIGSANLVSKVYFPRLIIPLASVGVGLVDLAVASGLLVAMMIYYGIALTAQILWTPLLLAGLISAAAGMGSLLSALTVAYRDFRYVIPFMVQLWMFVTPVIYPPTIVPERWRWTLSINPLSGLIDGFRAALLSSPIDGSAIAVSIGLSAAVCLAGAAYFRSVERQLADVL